MRLMLLILSLLYTANAASETPVNSALKQINADNASYSIEASGIIRLNDSCYILISDDTKDDMPVLYMMDTAGMITKVVAIDGITKMTDMESISQDDSGYIYIASSQSINKKGKSPEKRRMFIRISRDNANRYKLAGKMVLSDFLKTWATKYPKESVASYLIKAINDSAMDIEAMVACKDSILFGLKNPLMNGETVVLVISKASLLSQKSLNNKSVAIWSTFVLTDEKDSIPFLLSDMCFKDSLLYMTSCRENTNDTTTELHGKVWMYNRVSRKLDCIADFPNRKPEGITRGHDSKLLVVFDNGNSTASEYATIDAR